MDILFFFLAGVLLGYWIRSLKKPPAAARPARQAPTYLQKLYLKSHHQSDSDRIRELNRLSANQSVFLRLLKQTFPEHEVAIKQQRFIILDRDQLPRAIFEYRDGTQAMKMMDQEDGIPLFLYKALISAKELENDYAAIFSAVES